MVDFLFVEKFGEKVSVPLQMLSSRCSAGSVKRRGSSKCSIASVSWKGKYKFLSQLN